MISKLLSTLAIASGISLAANFTGMTPAASAQVPHHHQVMEADGFTLWNSGERSGIAFNVWTRPAALGGGYYYFLWEGRYTDVADTSNPEVVVFFEGNVVQLKAEFLVDCYAENIAYQRECQNPEQKPTHYRYQGTCIFPWQYYASQMRCGSSAKIPSPGIF